MRIETLDLDVLELPYRPGVYRVLNTVTGECYIGSTANIAARARSHASQLQNGKHLRRNMQLSYIEHGAKNFKIEVLEECGLDDLGRTEARWMDRLKPKFNGVLRPQRKGYSAAICYGISVRNPEVLQALRREAAFGAGENIYEAAENLLRIACEQRRLRRENDLILDGVEFRKAKCSAATKDIPEESSQSPRRQTAGEA